MNLDKTYNPHEIEDKHYKRWTENNYFHAEIDKNKKPFTIVIPPPNVTGQLHMGHALDTTLQDIIIRTKRMQGYSALWVPGTDHAGIATQVKVEEALRIEEGITKHDLGREKFLERVWDWKKRFGNRIIEQLKKLGSSCDWDRERFTMDEGCSKAVKQVFVNLYNDGLIYRGNRIINWCPSCVTALSDAEVEYNERDGSFWHIRYPVKDSDEYITIATTRPETMLGDTAVAVHPDDTRYTHLVGKTLILPVIGREIPVIADEYVDKDFGTGAVKITPAHDPNDFIVGTRHNLPQIKVMNDDASINEHGGKYCGMDRYDARKALIADLEEGGFLIKIEPHKHNVGECYRCQTTVEPITSLQWFVKMKPLAEESIEVVKDGRINFIPERFSKIYLNWMENVHDWCISRQLFWGHRIPAYYCNDCSELTVSIENITKCPKCGGSVHQDEDVLDTWFSSALWPFSTLGFPDNTAELDYFYPTSVLVTGYDIIFFWVARMIFSGMRHMKEIPFKHVFIHGLVRDMHGKKMSKSAGNGIDPLDMIEQYGADALRFTLASGNSPGNDMRFYIERVEASRNFANKIWNASRFVLMNLTIDKNELPDLSELSIEDKWILHKYNEVAGEVCENLESYELGIALSKLYDFVWDDFCDWYIELVKPRFFDKDNSNIAAQKTLVYVLSQTLKLLHPFMPFITEEIYLALPHNDESIMISPFPEYNKDFINKTAEKEMRIIMNAIKSIRNVRKEMNVPPAKKVNMYIITQMEDVFSKGIKFFERLSGTIVVSDNSSIPQNTVSIAVEGAELLLPQDELVDKQKELIRLNNEKAKLEAEIKRAEGKLSNKGFTDKAPDHVVEEERMKLAKYKDMLEKVITSIEKL